MGPYVYTIGNDYSLPPINVIVQTPPPNNSTGIIDIGIISFSSKALAVIIILVFLDIVLPIVAVLMDRKDYNNL